MTGKAYSFVRTFAAEPARDLCVDRHYLLCASAGAQLCAMRPSRVPTS
jgi:hypothetical protein